MTIQPAAVATGTAAAGQRGTAALKPPVARGVLWFALGHAILADALFYHGGVGIAVPLWIAAVALGSAALTARAHGRVPREVALWLTMSVVFAAASAWRESEALRFFNLVATAVCLLAAATTVHDARLSVFASRLSELAAAVIRTVGGA